MAFLSRRSGLVHAETRDSLIVASLLRGLCGGAVATWPDSRRAEAEQTEIANTYIQKTVLMCIDVEIPAGVIESFLLYFWFRCTVNRYGLPEAFFQKVERHWDEAIDKINRYMDAQAEADRRQA